MQPRNEPLFLCSLGLENSPAASDSLSVSTVPHGGLRQGRGVVSDRAECPAAPGHWGETRILTSSLGHRGTQLVHGLRIEQEGHLENIY